MIQKPTESGIVRVPVRGMGAMAQEGLMGAVDDRMTRSGDFHSCLLTSCLKLQCRKGQWTELMEGP